MCNGTTTTRAYLHSPGRTLGVGISGVADTTRRPLTEVDFEKIFKNVGILVNVAIPATSVQVIS